jgi:hypothetical protein
MEIMSNPRWEDYNFTYFKGNRYNYWGNGITSREKSGGDLAWYLSERGISYDGVVQEEGLEGFVNRDIKPSNGEVA